MSGVTIIGVGQTPVGEHWDTSLRDLAAEAAQPALEEAGISSPDLVIVGNMLSGPLSQQEHLGALVTDHLGFHGAESVRVDAADASGAAALRQGYAAVASGSVDYALVIGVEKFTDLVGPEREAAASLGLDADFEALQGATPAAMAALLMRRYMYEYNVGIDAFAGFSMNAHQNASTNPNAMFRNILKPGAFENAPQVASPVSLFDAAPEGDGAAAVVLARPELARTSILPIGIAATAVATDRLAVQNRDDPLFLSAAHDSSQKALKMAGIQLEDIDFFELHDSFTIMSVLALEACGFAERGQGFTLTDQIGRSGTLPISTFGGLKARGHAGGATGLYQAVEAVLQLRGEARENQIPDAKLGMTQSIGGIGTTAITHIFRPF